MKKLNIWLRLGIIVSVLASFGLLASEVAATEGTVELRDVSGGDSRCFAAAVLMQNFDYQILVSCRNLIYPGGEDVFNYTLWAQESGGDKVHKLGSLGYGKKQFNLDKAFDRLFVTKEKDDRARRPSDAVVMRGRVEKIVFLSDGSVAGTNEGDNSAESQEIEETNPFLSGEEIEQDRTNSRGFSILRLAGGIAVGIVVFLIVVAIVSASRRRPVE